MFVVGAAVRRVHPPFTRVAFAKLVVFPKEAVTVVAGDFLSGFDVPQHLHTRCISSRRYKLRDKKTSLLDCLQSKHKLGCFSFTKTYLAVWSTIWNQKNEKNEVSKIKTELLH